MLLVWQYFVMLQVVIQSNKQWDSRIHHVLLVHSTCVWTVNAASDYDSRLGTVQYTTSSCEVTTLICILQSHNWLHKNVHKPKQCKQCIWAMHNYYIDNTGLSTQQCAANNTLYISWNTNLFKLITQQLLRVHNMAWNFIGFRQYKITSNSNDIHTNLVSCKCIPHQHFAILHANTHKNI